MRQRGDLRIRPRIRVPAGKVAHPGGTPAVAAGLGEPGRCRSLTVKPSLVWRSVTWMSSWCIDPQPEPKVPVQGAAWHRDQACQAVGGAVAGVMDGDRDTLAAAQMRRSSEAAVVLCVGAASVTPIRKSWAMGPRTRQRAIHAKACRASAAGRLTSSATGVEPSSGSGASGRCSKTGRLGSGRFPGVSGGRDDAGVRALDDVDHGRWRGGHVSRHGPTPGSPAARC